MTSFAPARTDLMRSVSPELVTRVLKLKIEGLTAQIIADRLGVSKSTIRKVLRKNRRST